MSSFELNVAFVRRHGEPAMSTALKVAARARARAEPAQRRPAGGAGQVANVALQRQPGLVERSGINGFRKSHRQRFTHEIERKVP